MNQKDQAAYRVEGRRAVPFLIILLLTVFTWLLSVILKKEPADMIRNTVLAAIGGGCMCFP